MASNALRRPLPALISLVALLILTGLVWWRVIERDSGANAQSSKTTPASGCTSAAAPTAVDSSPVVANLPKASAVDVLVLNSTSTTGLAGKARTSLTKAGFSSPQPAGNYQGSTKITGVGEIRYGAKSAPGAALLGYYLPGAQLVRTSTDSAVVTVVLGPGYHSVRSAKAAQQAVKSAANHPAPRSGTVAPTTAAGC